MHDPKGLVYLIHAMEGVPWDSPALIDYWTSVSYPKESWTVQQLYRFFVLNVKGH